MHEIWFDFAHHLLRWTQDRSKDRERSRTTSNHPEQVEGLHFVQNDVRELFMILKDLSFETPQENILFDEVLLHLAEQEKAQETLRFWESPSLFIVLGKTSVLEDDVCLETVRQEKIPVLRRFSGGGTVMQGKGCLNFSLILSKQNHPTLNDFGKSYTYILGKVIEALAVLKVDAVFEPISDLALRSSGKKFSGNAQHRARNFILHHGTILYDFDLRSIERFLKMPQKVPDYRLGRTHSDFVANISSGAEEIKSAFKKVFDTDQEEPIINLQEQRILKDFWEKNMNSRIPANVR